MPYRGKRVVDLLLLAVVAVPAAFVGLACAIGIKLTSPGPVFFRQIRMGQHDQPFEIFKFRTMVDRADNPLFPDSDRITSVGAVLRRLSIDELPQLINVARGEMSIVGPRPAMEYQIQNFDQRQRGRTAVKPGLTGLAQTKGRNAIPWKERIEWDLRYIEYQSPRTDLALVQRTARVVLTGKGADGHPMDDPLTLGG